MNIDALHIDGFGKFLNYDLSFSEKINLLYGPNEAGKSTLFQFLDSMLYGITKHPGHRKDKYGRYLPWKNPGKYGGSLSLSYQGKSYELRRSFLRGEENFSLAENGSVLPPDIAETRLQEIRNRLSESSYLNTVSIGQLHSRTENRMAQELRQYLESIQSTGSADYSAERALDRLSRQSEMLSRRMIPDAAKNYAALIGEKKNVEKELQNPKYENLLQELKEQREEMKEQHQSLHQERENTLKELSRQREALRLSGFRSREEILRAEERAKELESGIASNRQVLKSLPSRRLTLFLLFLLALGCMLALCIRRQFFPILIPANCMILFLFLFHAVRLFQGIRRRTQDEKDRAELLSILNAQLHVTEIREDSLRHLETRFSELRQLFSLCESGEKMLDLQTARLNSLSDSERQLEEKWEEQHRLRTELEQKLSHLVNVQNRAEQLRQALSLNHKLQTEKDAVSFAMETIRDLSGRLKKSFGYYLNEKASQFLCGMTNRHYDSLWVNDGLQLFLNTGDGLVPIEEVSCGTIDQVYLSFRLALALLLQENCPEHLPLIFDDSFSLYDEKRLRSALTELQRSYRGQLLLFSCQEREEEVLKKAGIAFHKISL